jgi:uncharacterized protein (TIGR03084 family)
MIPETRDLSAEADEFDGLLASLVPDDWTRATAFKSWTIDDIVRHLHMGDRMALAAATDIAASRALQAEVQAKRATGLSRLEETRQRLNGLAGPTLRTRWRETLERLIGVMAALPSEARLPWAGPDMGVGTFTIARQMETWSHAQAIWDLLGRERPAPPMRLRNIAELGVRTFGWAYRNRGLLVPAVRPHISDWRRRTAGRGNGTTRTPKTESAATRSPFASGDADAQRRRHRARGRWRDGAALDDDRAVLRRPARGPTEARDAPAIARLSWAAMSRRIHIPSFDA